MVASGTADLCISIDRNTGIMPGKSDFSAIPTLTRAMLRLDTVERELADTQHNAYPVRHLEAILDDRFVRAL